MRSAVLIALHFAVGIASAAPWQTPAWPSDPAWRLQSWSSFDATQWQVGGTVLDRADIRQRLRLTGWPMRQRDGRPRMEVALDLSIGSDLGPEPDAFAAQPDARRMQLDLFAAHVMLRDLGDRVDVTLGRRWFLDAIGSDAVDGLTVEGRLAPWFRLELAGGFAARRQWSLFGPDLFTPDGTRLVDRRGHVVRARIATHGLRWFAASAGISRQFDAVVQSERVGASWRVGPRALHLQSRLRYDVIHREALDVEAAVGRSTRRSNLRLGWRRHRPAFSADSIWNAFVPVAHHAGFFAGDVTWAAWTLALDASARFYPPGPDAAQTPGLLMPVEPPAGETEAAWEGGARVTRRIDAGVIGASARHADGFGGLRQYGDVFTELGMPTILGRQQGTIRGRVGGVRFQPRDADARPVRSLWALLAGVWRPEESMRIEASAEWYGADTLPHRMRVMGRLVLEDWW